MRDVIVGRILIALVAPLAGAVLGIGLRGPWSIWLQLAFPAMSIAACLYFIVAPRDPIAHVLLGLGFYGVAFQGLLGPLEGAMGGMWFLLTIGYSVLQAGGVFLYSFIATSHTSRAIMLPFCFVAWEFLRHWATRLYDGAGLTFCLMGQALAANDGLLQIADLGGIWALTFLWAAASVSLTVWCVPNVTIRIRAAYAIVVTALVTGSLGYGSWALDRFHDKGQENAMLFLLCPNKPDLPSTTAQIEWIKKVRARGDLRPAVVVYPETSLSWNPGSKSPIQELLCELSTLPEVTVVSGAWLPAGENSNRNVCLILRGGSLCVAVDKLQLAPFIESQPLGTAQLISVGMIPLAATRNVTSGPQPDFSFWRSNEMSILPSVCYDLFFSNTYRRFPQCESIIVCCLDESFDGNGVFQELSRLHTRLRAVELRHPVVRCSLSGLSGAFDQRGQAITPCEVGQQFAVYEVLPYSADTLYRRCWDWLPALACLVCLGQVIRGWSKSSTEEAVSQ